MGWFEPELKIFRRGTNAAGQPRVTLRPEHTVADVWQAGVEEVVIQAKVRPALVVSREREHDLRKLVSLVPIYRVGDGAFFEEHRDEIRARGIPGLFWLDQLRINDVTEPRVVDCTAMLSVPLPLVKGRTRIGVLDPITYWAIKRYWSESVVAK